jgi:hypothetical protein
MWGNKNQLTIVLCYVLQNLGNETYWRICMELLVHLLHKLDGLDSMSNKMLHATSWFF